MKKNLFLLLILQMLFLPIHSQTTKQGVDTVKITCLYQQVCVVDTLTPEKKTDDLMFLQIGKQCSKYYSLHRYMTDSVSFALLKKLSATGQMPSAQEVLDERNKIPVNKISAGIDFQIYKNYPQKGQLTLYDHFGGDGLRYEETLPDMQWKLSNDTLTVCGYLCKKATASFRGRNYAVWYAREIPVSDGPWKLNGLPGLILKAIDEQEFFSFECISIETPETIKFITTPRSSSRKLSRAEYHKAKQRYMDSPGAYMSGNPVMQETSPLPAAAYKKRPYNPIERTDE